MLNSVGYESNALSLDDAWKRTAIGHTYISEDEGKDHWKSPAEFSADGGGDCEDFAIYMIYWLGEEADMVVLHNLVRKGYHAVVRYRGVLYDSMAYGTVVELSENLLYCEDYSYEYLMAYTTAGGIKGSDQGMSPLR